MKRFFLLYLSLVLTAGRGQAAAFYTVTAGTDSTDSATHGGSGTAGSPFQMASLRGAVIAANANPGSTITLPARTYSLTLVGSDNAAAVGDLDINASMTILGSGANTTIIQMVAGAAVGDNKVFGINQDGSHPGLTVAFSDVTITGGKNNFVATGTFQETGGGVDFFLTGTGNKFSMTNCVITGNSATGSPNSHGGGVNVDSSNTATVGGASAGTMTFNNCIFSNNLASHEGGGLQCFADKHDVFVINCTFINNNAENGGGFEFSHTYGGTTTMIGGLVTNNTATLAGGGLVIGRNTIVNMSGVTIVGNTSNGSGAGSSEGGGVAITELGIAGFTPAITLTNCIISNNHANTGPAPVGGGVFFGSYYAATLVNCTISGNSSGSGAGVYNNNSGSTPPSALTVNNRAIISNTASVSGGGVANANIVTAVTIVSNSTVSGNSAVISGGGFFIPGGTNTVIFSRIVNNTAPTGKAMAQTGGIVTATNNWWGTNAPATLISGSVSFTPWLQLLHTANPNPIFVPNSTTLTATFLTNSAGTAIPAANLSRLVGLPVTFNNPVGGTLSGAQATIQAAGTATATFTANAAGPGSATAVVDNQATPASITIPTGVSSINRAQATPTNLSSVSWTVTFTNAVSGVAAGNFSLVNGGLGGSPTIGTVTAAGSPPATSWTVTASTGSGTGTLGLNLTSGSGISAIINNLTFTGQVYTIDLVAPNTSITVQPPSLTNSASASFNFSGTDTGVGVAGFQYQLDGAAYTPVAAGPVNLSGLTSASHTFNVRAVDTAGNTDATPATVTWTVDTIPPAVNCSSDVVVTASGSCPPVVNFVVSVSDNLALSVATTNPASGSVFAVGTNTVALGARDTAGNTNFCTFKVIVLPGAAPLLSILRTGTNVSVSWSNSFPCYTLQFAPAVASNSWSPYPGPFATNSGKIFVTNSAPFTNRFFRLSF